MPSRFEPRRSRAGDPAAPIALVRPVRDQSPVDNDVNNDERPWQSLVRKLRQLIAIEDVPRDDADAKMSDVKPELRLLPGGRLDEPEEQRRSTATTRGKWH